MVVKSRHYGIPGTIVAAIRVLYDNSQSVVCVYNCIPKWFLVTTGVLQGDVLAPFLFVNMVDYHMTDATKE